MSRPSLLDGVLRRPVAMSMAFLLLLLLGAISYKNVPVALLPRGFQSPSLWVTIPYPGGTPREAEQAVAIPAEEMLRTIPGIQSIQSVSGSDSVNVTVEFRSGADMDLAYAEVSDRLERARPSWPDAIDDYFIFRFNSNTDLPIQWFALLYDEEKEDPHDLFESVVKPAIEAVDGVARIEVQGLPEQIVRVGLDRNRVEASRVSLFELAGRLQGENFSLPAGVLQDDGRRYLVRVDAKITDPKQLLDTPVRDELVVGDLTDDLGLDEQEERGIARINGRDALILAVSKVSTANTVAVGTALDEALDELRNHPRLQDSEVFTFFDQKEVIVGALNDVKKSAIIGGVLAILILNVFLRRLRLTIVVALAIPTSILMALIALYFLDRSFNVLSLAGFTLAVGMLVDNAIVVVENILRRRQLGEPAHQAAARGAGEIALAITLATGTTLVVFLPLVFMSDDRNLRIILGEVAGPISFSLLASLLTALVFLPLVALVLLRHAPKARKASTWSRIVRRPLAFVLRHRLLAGLGLVGLLMTTGPAWSLTRKGFGSDGEGGGEVGVNLEFQNGFTLEDADAAAARVESWFDERRDELAVDNIATFAGRRSGRVIAYFHEDADSDVVLGLSRRLRDELPEQPGVRYRVGRESGSGRRDVRVEIRGRDTERLALMAEEVALRLANQPSLLNVRSDLDRGMDEVRITLDRELAQKRDVSMDAFRGAVAWGLAGVRVSELELGNREIPVRLEYQDQEEADLVDLRGLPLVTNAGGVLPLDQLAQVSVERGPGAIVREGGRTLVGLTVTPAVEDRALVSREIREVMEAYAFPEGYGWVETDGAEEFNEGLAEIGRAFFLAIVLVFLLMGILFESAFLPLSVLPAIPIAILGAFWGLAASRVPMDETGMVAFVILAGIVVNNAIVLVDQINRNRRERAEQHGGRSRSDAELNEERSAAILDAAETRLRPILMTALTTIAGLIPMAMPFLTGGSQGIFSYQALAIAVLGGLVLSTALTPFVVPMFYTVFDDLGRATRRTFLAALPLRATVSAPTPSTSNAPS